MLLHGRLIPWPWTLNIAGHAHRYASHVETYSALRRTLMQTPGTRVDVGLAQINVGYHGHRIDLATMRDHVPGCERVSIL